MKKNKGTALITGATQGIGRELAWCFARGGFDVVLVARDREALKRVAATLQSRFGVKATILVKDLSRPAAPQKIFDELQRAEIHIDILVNNAGFGQFGCFADSDIDTTTRMMQVNMAALTSLTRLFLPQMIARRRGRVLNVASTAGFQPGPLMAVYYASKAYVLSFSEAIANELEGSGVTVTCLCPGPTRSEFQNRAQMSNSKLFENSLMSAAQVAQQGYRATMSGQTLVIPGRSNLVWAFFTRFLSRRQVPRMVRRVQDTKIASTETNDESSTRTMQEDDSTQEFNAPTTGEQ